MTLLALQHVSKSYKDGRREVKVLDDVSLELEEGEMIGVWGPRRSGKSTLLRVASGRELPESGRVFFDGNEVTRMSSDRRARLYRHGGIGLVGSDWRPGRNNSVSDHVAFPLMSDGISLRDGAAPAWRALEEVGCAACAHMLADRLSNAERVRVSLAQALVRVPRVLMVDDPTVLMRPSESVEFYELLRSLGRTLGLAMVIAAEDVAPIRTAARMFSIDGGQFRAMEQPGRVFAFPERPSANRRSQP